MILAFHPGKSQEGNRRKKQVLGVGCDPRSKECDRHVEQRRKTSLRRGGGNQTFKKESNLPAGYTGAGLDKRPHPKRG